MIGSLWHQCAGSVSQADGDDLGRTRDHRGILDRYIHPTVTGRYKQQLLNNNGSIVQPLRSVQAVEEN
jgi:hypothetical protein